MNTDSKNTETKQCTIPSVMWRCSNCEFWNREKIYNYPEKDIDAKIGQCSKLDSDEFNYWDSNDVANDKIKDGKIGCENLYTNENFGCIHFSNAT
ncbi:hypothetical protein N8Z33_00955 [Flavobacteriaceae bacterium]|nr:hypothetical protein [Flavobacteriaceae bacterium]